MKRCVFSFCLLIYGILILNVAWASPECERLAKDDNESRQVVKVCTELINNKIDEANNRFWRSLVVANAGLYQYALEDLNWIIERNPADAQAWSNRAAVYRDLKKFNEALTSVNKAIELAPGESDYFNTKGKILFYMENYQEALNAFDKSISLNFANSNAMRGRIIVLFKKGQVNEALNAWDQY